MSGDGSGEDALELEACVYCVQGIIFGQFRQMATEFQKLLFFQILQQSCNLKILLDLGDRLWARGDRGGLCGRSVTSGLVLGDNLGERGGL